MWLSEHYEYKIKSSATIASGFFYFLFYSYLTSICNRVVMTITSGENRYDFERLSFQDLDVL